MAKQDDDRAERIKLAEEETVLLQQRIAQAQLKTQMVQLAQAERANEEWQRKEEQRRKQNRERMNELAQMRAARAANVRSCRHKSGGRPGNIFKGGGVGSFSVISRTLMPDGVTLFLQCPRCRMAEYTPARPPRGASSAEMEKYAQALDRFNELLAASEDAGFDNYMRGPTFMFKNADDVPFIPARV